MDAQGLKSIIQYYAELLIIQYNNKPRAAQTIALLAEVLQANGITFDIQDGYAVDTAVGVQLDVIGKYVGVDRFYEVVDLNDFFALTDYEEVDPDDEDKWGFCTYATYDDFQYNGTLNYQSFLSVTNQLNDDDYRVIIRLKILLNNMNYSNGAIDTGINSIFGNDVRPSSDGDMRMWYIITDNLNAIIRAAMAKDLLPHPMGVGIGIINNAQEPFFGFAFYGPGGGDTDEYTWGDGSGVTWGDGSEVGAAGASDVLYSSNILGFTDYLDYDTSNGDTLMYENISG